MLLTVLVVCNFESCLSNLVTFADCDIVEDLYAPFLENMPSGVGTDQPSPSPALIP